jgi:hypothetical protein
MSTELTKVVRTREEEACVAFSRDVEPLGFVRTKKRLWVRLREHTADVLHLHRGGISYGAPLNASVNLRLHLAIRVLNDSFAGLHLNGPDSGAAPREGRYHLRFNAESLDSFDRCVRDLGRYVRDVGEPWLARFRHADALLNHPDSPLHEDARTSLRAAVDGRPSADALALTNKELGLGRMRSPSRSSGSGARR